MQNLKDYENHLTMVLAVLLEKFLLNCKGADVTSPSSLRVLEELHLLCPQFVTDFPSRYVVDFHMMLCFSWASFKDCS